MRMKMMVMEEGFRTFKSKGEERREYLFSGRDVSQPVDERCSNNIVYEPTQEDLDKFKGKLTDQTVEVVVKEIRVDFSGNVRVKGRLEAVKKAA